MSPTDSQSVQHAKTTMPFRLSALRITLIYILVAIIGLSLGDLFVNQYLTADTAVVLWGITEDLLFTLVSAAVVYFLVWRAFRTREVLEQHYSELFANTSLGIYRTTPEGHILAANSALIQMLGYTSLAELAQRNLAHEGLDSQQRTAFRAQLEREGQVVGLESKWQRRDGTTIYVRENARVSRNAAGAIVAYDGVVEDITERLQARLALEHERDVLRALLDSTVDTIYFKDTQSRFTRINQAQAQVLGVIDPQDAQGKTDADFFPPALAEIMLAEEQQVITTGRPSLHREEYNPTHDGQPRWFSVSKNALHDQTGQIIGLVGMSRDITAVKLREREFAAIAAIAAAMQASATRAQMLVAALEQITTLMRVEGAVIGLCDAAARAVTFEVASGAWSESRGTRIPIDEQLRDEIAHADRVQLAARWSASDLFQPINRGNRLPYLSAAPLQAQGAALGLLVVGRTQPITADEQRLFVACGDVVASALQRAAEHEQAQRRADQLATLNLLSRALAENLSEVEVYAPLARAITQLLPDLSAALISLFNPATQQIRCVYGLSGGQPVNLADFAPLSLNDGPQSIAIRTRQTVIANNWLTQQPTLTIIQTADNQAPAAALFAPMLAKDQVIGVVQVQSYQVERFSAEDGDLLMAIASTAAIVIENARLFDGERRQRARAEALARLAAQLNNQAELPGVLQTISDESRQALKADAASVYVHDVVRGELRIAAVAGLPDDFLTRSAPIAATIYANLLSANQLTFVVSDLRTMPDLPSAAMYQDYGLVTIALAGMLRDDQLIGVLTVKSIGRTRIFTSDELALLATFANQAAVAVQNAQLLAAEREQRIFMEALRDTAAALNSTLNVDEVLDRVLDNIGRVAPHDAANIMLVDSTSGERVARVARCHGYDLISPDLNMEVRRLRLPVMQLANLRQMVETGQPCIISNIKTYPNWIDTPSTHWQSSYVGAPIHLRDSVVGFIQLDSRQVNFFPPIVAERLQFFADQAAIAIENARLFQAEREQHSLAEALRDTSGVLAGTLDLDEVLDRILSNVGHIVPNDVASLLLIEHGVTRVLRIVGNLTPDRVARVREVRLVVAETPNLQRILETQEPHFIADTSTDPNWKHVPEIDWIKSNIVAPMIVKGQIVGMLALDSRQTNFYAASHAERLQIFAAQAAVALENAQLFDAAQQRLKELAALFDGSRAMTASLDRTTVLNTITQQLCQAVDATSVYVLSVDLVASVVHMLAEYFSPAANDLERVSDLGATYRLDDLPDTLEALRQGQPSITIIDDPQAEPVAVKQLHTYGGQSSLRVPMNVADKIRAYAVIWDSRSARHWTEAEIRLCQTLANQAAVALENVRLLEETQQGLKEQSALLAASTAVSSSLDLRTMLKHLAEQMGRAIDATSVYICEWNQAANTSTVVVEYYGPNASAVERMSDLGVTYDLTTDYGLTPLWQQPGGSLVAHVDDEDLSPHRAAHLRQYGCWSVLTVGLTAKAKVFGYIELWETRQRRTFTRDEVALCQAIAQQAAIAFENARLFEAERKQLRLAQTLQAVGALLTAQMSLDAVYQNLFDLLARVIDYDSVSLQLIVDDRMQLAAGRGFRNMVEAGDIISGLPAPWLSAKWSNLDQRYSVIRDTHADPRWTLYPGSEYIRSWIGAVLRVKGRLLGILNVDSSVPGAYSGELGETVAAFANQAAIAIENARLFEAERKQLRLAQTLQAVGALLTAQMSLNEVFDYVFDLLARVVEYDSVSVQLVEGDRLALTAGRGFPDTAAMRDVISHVSKSTLEERWGATHTRVMTLPDTYADPRWIIHPGSEYIRSWIGAALRVKGRLLGILNVDSATPGTYTEEIGETVAAFANQAAIAIENAQLHEAVRRHADELEERVVARTTELDRERKRTAAILDTAGEGIIFTDVSGTIEYINQAMERLTGYQAHEALEQNPRLWRSGQTSPALYHELWDTIKRGRIWQGELVNRRKDGRLYDAALTIAPLYDAESHLIGFVGVQHDVTQRKELDRLKDEFVSNVSHELRTPIANVKLYISLLTRGKPERHDEYLQTLRRESARLETLIENLLDLSRLDLDTVKVDLQPVDLNQLTAQLIGDRTALAASRQHVIDYHADERMVLALADPAALSQVFSNLLTNAINYTPPNGLITVSVAYREHAGQNWATITVKDTGPGITATDLPHLFQRFYRGEAGRKSGAPGTGLGLAISDKIIDRLGGQLTVESQPGRGAAFTVWLRTL